MSRVIKNDDGVTVVEGTPAASLVKDVDKFFATKPPERMAGESIAAVRKDTFSEQGISKLSAEEKAADIQKENELRRRLERGVGFTDKRKADHGRPVGNPSFTKNQTKDNSERQESLKVTEYGESDSIDKRNEAKDKAESRRKGFFERRRSTQEAERSQTEQEATQGKFITTLGR